jgi:hypothetical protein
MHVNRLILAAAAVLALAGVAHAQSLSPMHNAGVTPSDVKGFKLDIGNPYKTRMTFQIIPMDPKFRVVAADAEVNFPEITLAPNAARQVIVTFRINPAVKERTIGVCVQPKDMPGTVQPRVCGTYTGKLLSAGG